MAGKKSECAAEMKVINHYAFHSISGRTGGERFSTKAKQIATIPKSEGDYILSIWMGKQIPQVQNIIDTKLPHWGLCCNCAMYLNIQLEISFTYLLLRH